MSQQLLKTLAFVGAAVVLAGGAYLAYPRPKEFKTEAAAKNPLFPKFKSDDQAARIVITKINEELGTLAQFEVVKDPDRGIWVLPAHERYPADSEERITQVSTALIDLTPINVVSVTAADQATYGVLKPSQDTEASQTGTGLLVTIENEKGSKLSELIIGKKGSKKGADAGAEDKPQYFVRKPTENAIYIAEIDPTIFSTDFKEWIKRDLLQLDAFDIARLDINDYTVPHEVVNSERGIQVRVDIENLKRRMRAIIHWKNDEAKWELDKLLTFQGKTPVETSLGELEELNSEKLNDLKNTLGGLSIVAVRKKPEGLGADLKAGRDFLNKRESLLSLQELGFYPWPVGNQLELFAENGELVVATKDGVEYLMRFGRTESVEANSDQLNRVVMVMARIDESQFNELPADVRRQLDGRSTATPAGPAAPAEKQLQPPAPFIQDAPAKKKTDNTKQGAKKEPAKSEGAKPSQKKAEADKDNQKKDNQKKETQPKDTKKAGDDDTPVNPLRSDKKTPADKEQGKKQGEGDEKPAAGAAKSDSGTAVAEDEAAKEAQRKLDELKERYLKARVKVADLNFRFGDWYYVISEDDYRKIHLTRRDLTKETAQAKEKGFDVDAFRSLKDEGLKPAPPAGAPGGAPGGFPSFPGQGN